MAFVIRAEKVDDHQAIRDIVAVAFGRCAEADLVDQLRQDGDAVLSLLASEDGTPVGHIMLSRMAAPLRALALAPVSVLPRRQRCGLGTLLVREGLARAEQCGWEAVVVLGEPAFYGRFGFDPALAQGFRSPYAGPYLMVKALTGSLPVTTGHIDYPAAFSRLEVD